MWLYTIGYVLQFFAFIVYMADGSFYEYIYEGYYIPIAMVSLILAAFWPIWIPFWIFRLRVMAKA